MGLRAKVAGTSETRDIETKEPAKEHSATRLEKLVTARSKKSEPTMSAMMLMRAKRRLMPRQSA